MPVSVYRRDGSPYWWFNVPAGYSADGKRSRVSTKRTLKREAQEIADIQLKELLDLKQYGGGLRELTFREAIFDHYLPAKVKSPSYRNLERDARKVVGEFPGIAGVTRADRPFHELTTADIRTYRNKRQAQGAAPATIDLEVKVVSAAYHMVEDSFRVRQGLKFPMFRPKGKPRPLTEEEETALIADLQPGRDIPARGGGVYHLDPTAKAYRQRQDNYDLVVMLLDTGARFGEIAHLTWDVVDTVGWRWLHIYREKVQNEGNLLMTNRVREVLQRRFKERGNGHYVFRGWSEMTDEEPPKASTQAIRRSMNKLGFNAPHKVKRYGRRDVRSLRDTFATKLRMKGLALSDLQPLLGHASMQMTMKYADVAVDVAAERAVALLDADADRWIEEEERLRKEFPDKEAA
jgi:integrase